MTPADLFEITALVYNRWAQEFELLKQVKSETDDGSADWAEFHAARLESHSRAEAKWKALLKACQAEKA